MVRVLIIDDEVQKAQPLIRYFQEICEWDVEIASGPDEALELLPAGEQCPFDVIILDVMMEPGKTIPSGITNAGRETGLKLLEIIVKRYTQPVKVIVYTARTDLGTLRDDGRIAAYVQKPGAVRDLVVEINRALEQSAS